MKQKTAMKKKRAICLVLASILLAGTISAGILSFASKNTSTTSADNTAQAVISLSYADAADVFEKEFDSFNALIVDVNNAIAYYDDNDLTTTEDVKAYEAMWKTLSDDAKAIQTALAEKKPPEEYEDLWNDFADCMGQISDTFETGTNFGTSNEAEGTKISDSLREINDEFVALSIEACGFANDLAVISATIKTDYFFLQIYNSEDQLVTKYRVTLAGIVSDTRTEITSVSFDLVSGDACVTDYKIEGNAASVLISHPTEGYLSRIFMLGTNGAFSAE